MSEPLRSRCPPLNRNDRSPPPATCPIGESEFVRAIAEESDRRGGKTKICAGIVSFADLRLPNVDAVLEAQIAAADGPTEYGVVAAPDLTWVIEHRVGATEDLTWVIEHPVAATQDLFF